MPDPEPPRLTPTHEEAMRELHRVADRLRVIGPRMAARGTADAADVLRRVRGLLQELADLGAELEPRPAYPVPDLEAHALADQLLVLGHEALGGADGGAITDLQRGRLLSVLRELRDLL